MDITNAVAVVTGGASGLGLATAGILVSAGAHVVLLDLPTSNGPASATALGERARFAPVDVTDEHSVRTALDVAAGLGPMRVAVNCAGVGDGMRVLGTRGTHPLDLFARTISVNVVGTFNVIRLRQSGWCPRNWWVKNAESS